MPASTKPFSALIAACAFGFACSSSPHPRTATLCAKLDTLQSYNGGADAATIESVLGEPLASKCVIDGSHYQTTCAKDADCAAVGLGNACSVPCEVLCPTSAINVASYARYQADVAAVLGPGTGYASAPSCEILCGCGDYGEAHCKAGSCVLSSSEVFPTDASTD